MAAVEFALTAPMLVMFCFMLIDCGRAFIQQGQVVAAVSAGVQFAALAIQNGTAIGTAATEASTVIQSVSNASLTASNITVTINNNTSSSNRCCVGYSGGAATWSCGNPAPTCSDGSNPGVYFEIHATSPFHALFSSDTLLVGKSLTSDIIERVQ